MRKPAQPQDPPPLEDACARLEAAAGRVAAQVEDAQRRAERSDGANRRLGRALEKLDSLLDVPSG